MINNNIAPAELNKHDIPLFYCHFAPMEQKLGLETQIDQLVYELYDLTEEIEIIEQYYKRTKNTEDNDRYSLAVNREE